LTHRPSRRLVDLSIDLENDVASDPPGPAPKIDDVTHAGDGFFISCFPHKIRGASAGWTRAVAIFDERLTGAR